MKKSFLSISLIIFTILLYAQGGGIDYGFNSAGADRNVSSITILPDEKIIITGTFDHYGDKPVGHIARLNPNGQIDIAFNTGTGANGSIETSTLQPDGKILLGGIFTTFNNISSPNIVRLNQDGTVDTDFNAGIDIGLNIVHTIVVQPDGKILIGGVFATYDGVSRNNIARLNPDGSLDTSFNPGSGANGYVGVIKLLPDNKILVGGMFTSYNGITQNRIARLNPDGSLDTSFNQGTGANEYISTLAILPDNKILIGGNFTSYNDIPLNRIARLNPDGTPDGNFLAGMGADNYILSINVQEDQKIIIAGAFEHINGVPKKHIARLNDDGSLDIHFNGSANDRIAATAIQNDGKIIIGGSFTSYNGTARGRIARLHDGCAPTANIQNITLCNGQSFTFNNHTYTEAGTYIDTLQTAQGCDSFMITSLSFFQSSTTYNVQVILCEGESHIVGSNIYTSAGKYTDTLQAQQGCDSIVVTDLFFIPKTQINTQTICEGKFYTIGSKKYGISGIYEDTLNIALTPERSCQVITTLHLTVTPAPIFHNPQTICQGSTYSINNKAYTTSGTYYDTVSTSIGCDSIIMTELSIVEVPDLSVSQSNNELSVETISGITYQWIDCEQDFAPIENETSPVFIPQSNGSYAVTVNNKGCISTSDCYAMVTTQLTDRWTQQQFTLFPNPATNVLHLRVPTSTSVNTIRIMNLTGQLMLSTDASPINIEILPKGLYILAIETVQGTSYEQFMKE